MARTLRIEYPGAIYHITCRLVGSWQAGDRDLFVDDADRWRFLETLGARVEAFGVRLHQYVLQQNHFLNEIASRWYAAGVWWRLSLVAAIADAWCRPHIPYSPPL